MEIIVEYAFANVYSTGKEFIMKKIEKMLLGIEGIVYFIFGCIILYHMCDFKYVKLANWKGAIQYGGVGILLPFIGIITAGILLKKDKRKIARIIQILLIPYFAITCFCGFVLLFGVVTCSETNDLVHYKQYDKEVEKNLERYHDILPEKSEKGITLTDYNYRYIRTFNDNFVISVGAEYQENLYMEKAIAQLKEKHGATVLQENEKENIYQYGKWIITYNMETRQVIYRMEY